MDTIVTPVTVITLDSTRIVHNIKADLVARYFPPVVRLVQYDQSLPIIAVSLMKNGQAYTLPNGAAANIRVHKPDATYVYNPALGCDSTRNIVYFEVTQAMAAANGDGLAIVEIVVDGDIAGTSLITLHFEENPVPEDAIESSDEWETIYELGERIIASTVTPVSTAAGMTDHNVVYLYTGTESGWNQGHMYYYNGTTWVDAGIAVTDNTLTVSGMAADAKTVGDRLTTLDSDVANLEASDTTQNADISALKEEITDIIDSAYVTDTASGSIASFPDGADGVPVKSLKVAIEPVQDLNGYDSPWAGGGGKNLLNNTATTKTVNGVTFTVNADGTITANGTATAAAQIQINFSDLSGNYKYTGCPSGGGNNKYDVYPWDADVNTRPQKWDGTTAAGTDYGNTLQEIQIPSGHHGQIVCRVFKDYTVNNLVFKPMIVASDVTDATYAPYENICPISGYTRVNLKRAGQNLLHIRDFSETSSGITVLAESDKGSVTLTGARTSTGVYNLVNASSASNVVYLKAGKYIASCENTNADIYMQILDSKDSVIALADGRVTEFTLSSDAVIKPRIFMRGGVTTNMTLFPMITPTRNTNYTFEPYNGQEYTINLGGTIYGGDLDVTTGTLTNKSEYKTLSTSDWTRLYDNQCVYYIADPSKAIGTNNIISDMFKTDRNRSNNSISGSASTRGIYVRDDSCTTLEEFKTKYPTINVLFERATPQTVQLTANEISTLLGQNNIWADCGDTTVEYRADTKLYIEKLTAPTEDDMIADHAISANSFFMVGNILYRATTAIASGATITVGTNATKLSLSDALNALA